MVNRLKREGELSCNIFGCTICAIIDTPEDDDFCV